MNFYFELIYIILIDYSIYVVIIGLRDLFLINIINIIYSKQKHTYTHQRLIIYNMHDIEPYLKIKQKMLIIILHHLTLFMN